MPNSPARIMHYFKDPIKEIQTIRKGIAPEIIEDFLTQNSYIIKDVLERLHIPKSTYLAKKKNKNLLDSAATEKFFRLISVINEADAILGSNESKNWLYKKIGSLGNQMPIDLLDTEVGHRLVEQALLQIKYGIYN